MFYDLYNLQLCMDVNRRVQNVVFCDQIHVFAGEP